jgi:arylsulfate sulfotransferase
MLLAAAILAACERETPPELDEPPPEVDGPALEMLGDPAVIAPVGLVGGARRIEVLASRPAALEVALVGAEGERRWVWPAAEAHSVPLVGLRPNAMYTLALALEADGERVEAEPIEVRGDTLPQEGFPRLEVLVAEPDRMSPGYTMFTTTSPGGEGAWALMLDASLAPVWWAWLDLRIGELELTERGTLIGIGDYEILELDWLGAVVRRLAPPDNMHHELIQLEGGGLLTLAQTLIEVDAFPVSYESPDELGPATILDNQVVELDPTGQVARSVSLAEVLDPRRIGFNSLDPGDVPGGFDWAHANAVVSDDDDGTWIVSVRHQDALVKVVPDTGEVRWILGDPLGWAPPLSDRLLAPTGAGFRWPYHAHAPEVERDGELLRILAFDNGNEGYTPYGTPPAEPVASRLVEMVVDEDAGTVSIPWSYAPELDGPLYSFALGDCDRLENSDVLGVWGMLRDENGQSNLSAGRGRISTRIVEVDPGTSEAVLDLRVDSQLAAQPFGWSVYRAERLTALHPSAAGGDLLTSR